MILPFFTIFSTDSKACALCSMYDPSVFVEIDVHIKEDRVDILEIEWEFSRLFTNESIKIYDENRDGRLEGKELEKLRVEYHEALFELGYHTSITLDGENIDPSFINYRENEVYLLDEILRIKYRILVDRGIKEGSILGLNFFDKDGFYIFFPREGKSKITSNNRWYMDKNTNFYSSVVTIALTKEASLKKDIEIVEVKKDIEKREDSILLKLSLLMSDILRSIQTSINDVHSKGSILSWLALILLSLSYGAVHALGPGHGKTVVSSYMLSNKKTYTRGWIVALLIGIIHILSALVLTTVAFFIIKTAAVDLALNSELFVQAISGLIILSLGIFLIYRKILSLKSNTHLAGCGCSGCSSHDEHRGDLSVALASGLIPCPGTVLVFITIYSVGAVFAGLVSAIFMSIGMSLIIGLAATMSIKARGSIEKHLSKYILYIEFLALLVMSLFGVLMFLPIFVL